jgi:glyoxylase-like metal-dependent hydrolase (beta-lactamase superfamily II)
MIVEDGVYAYLWEDLFDNNCNSYVLGEKRGILVDVGHQRHVSHLLRGMDTDRISLDQIDLIMITHSHPDHLEALPSLLDGRLKATFHRAAGEYLREEGAVFYQMMGAPVPSVPIDFYLQEGNLQVGKSVFEIIHTPGHSPGSICIYWPEKKVLVSGDLLFHKGVGRTDFPGGDAKQLIESIEKVRSFDVEILLPGHGDIIRGHEQVQENFRFIEENYYAFL